MKLKGKVAVITGSGQGIGKIYAQWLANEGAKVVVADINYEKAQSVAAELNAQNLEALAVSVDVTNEMQLKETVQKIIEKFGTIDILVNNAAMFSTLKMKSFEEISSEEWDQVLAINLKGMFLCCKAIVPIMKKQKSGRIINTSAAAVLAGRPYYLHYTSSKAGVIGFTRSLAREVGDYNITVNSVAPGATYTEIPRTTVTDEQKQQMLNEQCIKRYAKPEDSAGIVAFLCTDEAGFISGQLITVDGGLMMH